MAMLSSRFAGALTYANELHAGQVRKASETPYIAHLLAVTAIVLEHGGGEDEAIAALLHDAIEDAGGAARREDIRVRFGDEVVAIIDACSDNDGAEPKPPWVVRKEAYIAHLDEVDDRARLVTACDKLHNLRAVVSDYRKLGSDLWRRFNGGREGTMWYYRAIVDKVAPELPAGLGEELGRAIDELEALVRAAEPSWTPGKPASDAPA